MNMKAPPGVFDILPNDPKELWRSVHLWSYLENVIRKTAREFNYQEIRTPILERTELFIRGVGETSDIVSKEMYTFEDKGGRSLTMRPEGTAPVMRAFIEHGLNNQAPFHKLFYIGPMFRYERSQAGRYRQHHQLGAEAIGIASPEQDAELIDFLYTLYQRLGLRNLQVNLNCIGSTECRINYRKALQDYLRPYLNELSPESQTRFEINPLRILDSKDDRDNKITANAPSILDCLSQESRNHFETLKKLLTNLNIPYIINPKLVRGLDYYNQTVFEVIAGELGAQNSVGGGGRYDGLLKNLGGPDLPAVGFGTGLERIIQTMIKQNVPIPPPQSPILYIIPLGDQAKEVCFNILHQLRASGVTVEMDFTEKKLGKIMQYADQIRARFVAVVGENEIASGEVDLKEMATGTVTKAPLNNLARILNIEAQSDEFVKLWNEMSLPFQDPKESEFFIQKLYSTIQETEQLSENLRVAVEGMKDIIEKEKK